MPSPCTSADAIAALVPPNETLLIDAYCGTGFLPSVFCRNASASSGSTRDIHAIAAARPVPRRRKPTLPVNALSSWRATRPGQDAENHHRHRRPARDRSGRGRARNSPPASGGDALLRFLQSADPRPRPRRTSGWAPQLGGS